MFKFSFGGPSEEESLQAEKSQGTSFNPAEEISINVLKSRAPRISYTKDQTGLPRRDLFDVRYELMSADDLNDEEKLLLGTEDVRKNVYEGGLKVWEGTYDLLEVLASQSPKYSSVLELGCGAGIPACNLFYQQIRDNKPGKFVLADYNSAVLRLLTMPNLVLAWLASTNSPLVANDHDEIILEASIFEAMEQDLTSRSVNVQFVAGAWSTQFSELVGGPYDLVLASETIYSLETVPLFTDVVKWALTSGTSYIAAKKIYFGVGGDIVEFERQLDQRNMSHEVILEKGSVGRVVLKVQNQ